ncbi:G2/mitotic-specific cyclin cdc13 [Ceratobasidium sp. AG-Ba]|nr:G2/mitotic-specific cyclin cdc13 [Ceratobasidium sp. AG-Ba]
MNDMEVDTAEPFPILGTSRDPATDYAAYFNQAVSDAIQERRQTIAYAFVTKKLSSIDSLDLFRILVLIHTGSEVMDADEYFGYYRDHPQLKSKLRAVYKSGAFASLLGDTDMPAEFQNAPSELPSSDGDNVFKSAFKERYLEDVDDVFIQSLNDTRRLYSLSATSAERPYNWSIAVIQSSGTGKSRMMDQVGNKVFTIPINLREEVTTADGMNAAFPPPDDVLREYFVARMQLTDEEQQGDYAVFLLALFDKTLRTIQRHWKGMEKGGLASSWANYMRQGLTIKATGKKRANFYAAVISDAESLRKNEYEDKTLQQLKKALRKSCDRLMKAIHPNCPAYTDALLVSFDGAHILSAANSCHGGKLNRSAYQNLGSVLAVLSDKQVFFVFLSTNSRLEDYAPSSRDHPSLRAFEGSLLIPPFNELPFDLYEPQTLDEVGPLTLENMCRTNTMVGFGRPLWHSQHKIDPTADIFQFACDKLTSGGAQGKKQDALVAALGILIGISFDSKNSQVVSLESRLVESHMRVSYSIPGNRGYMRTGSPSEPVLAEGAARYFGSEDPRGLSIIGSEALIKCCEAWMMGCGERGQFTGRLIAMCAYHIGLRRFYKEYFILQPPDIPRYHRPIPVLRWLRALFGKQFHKTILDATPVADQDGSRTLKEQFSGAYVFFSHFALTEDEEMLTGCGLATALMRGMAMQCKDNQVSIDAVIPIHMGSPNTPISVNTCSAINLRFLNREKAKDCPVNRSITVPETTVPVISIVFELGVKGRSDVAIRHQPHPPTLTAPVHPEDNHYTIVAYGCNSVVFGAIPSQVEANYKSFLGRETILGDFPRNHIPRNVEMLRRLNPSFNGERQAKRYPERFA